MIGTLKVEVTGNYRQGVGKASGKPYCMFQGFILLPNVQYPQMLDFYAETPQQVPRPGVYDCDITVQILNGKLDWRVDPAQGRITTLTSLNMPPLSAAPKVASAG